MQHHRHLSLLVVLGLCLSGFFGCAEATTIVSPAQAPPPKPGMARVWFFRPSLTPQFGAVTAFSPEIFANGTPVAAIAPGTTFYRDFAPGIYRFMVQPYGLPTSQTTTLQLAPGTQDYLQVDWISSWTQGYPEAGWSFSPNTFGILSASPQVAQAYIQTLAYLGDR
ncbi:MAG TPA: hypothetical protein VL985_10480 [Stellaceae bacterium]|nr:hypothetical protein [Stellaceae bacterium]